ncbi:MAG: sodium ion-translocating decarboxylase subunit beta [Candidatus Methanomethylicaceae archaeon]
MKIGKVSQREKLIFAVVIGSLLCLLFPSAAPLFASFFLGVVIKEVKIERYSKFLDEVVLSGSTFFLAFVLGALTTSDIVTNPKVFLVLVLGITSLIVSCVGGAIGGMILYYISEKKINPLLGPAWVSCVPTTAKISQKNGPRGESQELHNPLCHGSERCGGYNNSRNMLVIHYNNPTTITPFNLIWEIRSEGGSHFSFLCMERIWEFCLVEP